MHPSLRERLQLSPFLQLRVDVIHTAIGADIQQQRCPLIRHICHQRRLPVFPRLGIDHRLLIGDDRHSGQRRGVGFPRGSSTAPQQHRAQKQA